MQADIVVRVYHEPTKYETISQPTASVDKSDLRFDNHSFLGLG